MVKLVNIDNNIVKINRAAFKKGLNLLLEVLAKSFIEGGIWQSVQEQFFGGFFRRDGQDSPKQGILPACYAVVATQTIACEAKKAPSGFEYHKEKPIW